MTSVTERLDQHLSTAYKYGGESLWEFAHKELDEAGALCDDPSLTSDERRVCRRRYLHQKGGIERRQGDFTGAIATIEYAIREFGTHDLEHARMLGELGTAFQRLDKLGRADQLYAEQYALAVKLAAGVDDKRSFWRAEALAARAIGYRGLMAYMLSVPDLDDNTNTNYEGLSDAIDKCKKRVEDTRKLLRTIVDEDAAFQHELNTMTCICVPLQKLSLCYLATGDTAEAVNWARESVAEGKAFNPTMQAWGRFFLGLALQRHGDSDEAMRQWTRHGDGDLETAAIALCHEPCTETIDYMKQLVKYQVPLDHYNAQGYSPLDYAIMGGSEAMAALIMQGLRQEYLSSGFTANETEVLIERRKDEADRRKEYRTVFQTSFRPLLRAAAAVKAENVLDQQEANVRAEGCIADLRKTYSRLLLEHESIRSLFDHFKYIPLSEFRSLDRLPRPSSLDDMHAIAGSVRTYRNGSGNQRDESPYVIFLSYRWLGNGLPDDDHKTQLGRMNAALSQFLEVHPWLSEERVVVWLDVGCINQLNDEIKQRGINALPLIIAQCNAMISLHDSSYHSRAWCSIEVLIMQTLRDSYGLHEVWSQGSLSLFERATTRPPIDDRLTGLLLSFPDKDEPTVRFLVRQSRILAKA